MPARARFFLQFPLVICSGFLVDVLQRSWSHRVTAQSRREDAVGVGAAWLWGFSWSPQRIFSLEGLTIQLESFAEGFVALFQHSS